MKLKRNWKSLMVSGTVLTVLAGALTACPASVGQLGRPPCIIRTSGDAGWQDPGSDGQQGATRWSPSPSTGRPICRWLLSARRWGMDVRWDADTNTVILNTKGTGTTAAESSSGWNVPRRSP